MSQPPSDDASCALFTLAGGVEIATGQSMLEAVGRAKLASILFDEVVVESGLHVVEMSASTPAMVRRRTAADISQQLLKNTRTVERGTKTGLVIRRGGNDDFELYAGLNIPQLSDVVLRLELEVEFRYVSEYHTGLLDELARIGADWIHVVEIARDEGEESTVKPRQLTILNTVNESDAAHTIVRLDPDEAESLAGWLAGDLAGRGELSRSSSSQRGRWPSNEEADAGPHERMLAEDLAEAVYVAGRFKAVPTLSSAFQRVASERGIPVGIPGAESLGLFVPNFSVLPWEAIARFREHQGSVEARGRLREFEVEAAARKPHESADLVRDTAREVARSLIGVITDLAPKLSEDLRAPLLGSAVGLVPVVGQYASLAVSMGDAISALRQHRDFEGSWVAAMLQLRDAAIDTLIDW